MPNILLEKLQCESFEEAENLLLAKAKFKPNNFNSEESIAVMHLIEFDILSSTEAGLELLAKINFQKCEIGSRLAQYCENHKTLNIQNLQKILLLLENEVQNLNTIQFCFVSKWINDHIEDQKISIEDIMTLHATNEAGPIQDTKLLFNKRINAEWLCASLKRNESETIQYIKNLYSSKHGSIPQKLESIKDKITREDFIELYKTLNFLTIENHNLANASAESSSYSIPTMAYYKYSSKYTKELPETEATTVHNINTTPLHGAILSHEKY